MAQQEHVSRERESPRPSSALPSGTVTFLMTDIEGSTRLLQQHAELYPRLLDEHQQLLRQAVTSRDGQEIDTQGDGCLFAFPRAADAVAAAVEAQHLLAAHAWPEGVRLRVRMALHTGEPAVVGDEYIGLAVVWVARLCPAGHGGQVLLTSAARELVESDQPEGVQLRPLGDYWLKDLPGPERIHQLVIAELPNDFPPLRLPLQRPSNVPRQLTPLIGREREVAEVRSLLLNREVGLVTLTGPAGTGKTRLALALAELMLGEFRDGVVFVALAPLRESSLVVSATVRALGLQEAGGTPLEETLLTFLRDKQLLLVLDNFEHLLDAAPLLARLLSHCPDLKLLVTSRAVLHLYGEHDLPVPPLELPDLRELPPAEQLSCYPAIALFEARARAIKSDFKITASNAPAVAEVCARLDGLPLAIELAAARVNVLSPQAMQSRLQRSGGPASLQLLTSGARDHPSRHQTLRDAIGWSYDLLEPDEQALFRSLAVFVGSFALDAAEAVVAPTGRLSVFDGLASLVDKSLLQRRGEDPRGEPRFSTLETIREFGLERLQEQGELQPALRRHAEFFVALAEEGERQAGGANQAQWLTRLDDDHPNFRAALSWALSSPGGDPGLGLRLAAALWVFWFRRGYLSEGSRWLQQALAANPSAPPLARARLLTADGSIARMRGEFARGSALLEAGAALYRELGEAEGLAWALSHLGLVKQWLGFLDEGVAMLDESLELRRRLGDRRGVARSMFHVAVAEDFRRNYQRAAQVYQETLEVQRELGDSWGMGRVLGYLSKVMLNLDDPERAAELAKEALTLSRSMGDRWGIGVALAGLAGVAWTRGDLEQGAALLKHSLITFRDVGTRDRVAECLQELASLALLAGQPAQTVTLSAAAGATQSSVGLALWPAVAARRDRDLELARAGLGETEFERARSEGQALSLDQAIDLALTVLGTPAPAAADTVALTENPFAAV